MRSPFLLLLLFFLNTCLQADTNLPSSEPLSLERCIKEASANNPLILKTEANIRASHARLWQSYTSFFPTAGVSLGLTSLSEEPVTIDFSKIVGPNPKFPQIAGNPLLQYSFQDNWTAGMRVGMPVFTGGRNIASVSLAKADLHLAQEQSHLQISQLKTDLTRAYYGTAVNRMMRDLTAKTIIQLDRRAVTVSNCVKAGTATELELMRTRVLRATWAAKLSGMERSLEANLNRLSSLTGIKKNMLILSNREIPLPLPVSESLEEASKRALTLRPEVAVANFAQEISKSSEKIRISALLPQAGISWNYNMLAKKEKPGFSESDWRNWWDLRLSVSWDFFNLSRWTEVSQSDQDCQSKNFDVKIILDRVLMEAEDAYRGLDESRKAYDAAEQNLALAKMTADTARSRKQSGTITETEEMESTLGETEALVQKLRAQYDLAVAAAEYRRATGLE